MRKLILYMVMSLDGFVCGENDELDWEVRDDEVSRYFVPMFKDRVDSMLLGSVLYKGFEQAWPAMAKDPNSPSDLVEFAHWIENTPKYVFSNTLDGLSWQNSELVKIQNDQDILEKVNELKQQDGKDMVTFGGARFAQTLVKLGLVDEYQLKIQPIALGKGKALFSGLEDRLKLRLIDCKSFDSGVIAARYEPVAVKGKS